MISVIVPVYNVKTYLSQCIESIIHQTYTDLDIILVDDGSTDGSGDVCEEFAQIDSRIRVFHKPNGGLSDARNYGITQAKSKEITFIDSDDYISIEMIEKLHSLKKIYNAQMSVCFRQTVSENNHSCFYERQDANNCVFSSKSTEESFKIYFESKGGGLVAWGKLYDIKLFDKIKYPIGRYNEDVFTTYRLIAQCTQIAITTERLYYYRIRQGSIMNKPFEIKHLDAIYGNLEMTSFIESNYPKLSIYPQKLLLHTTLKVAMMMYRCVRIDSLCLELINYVLFKYKSLLISKHISLKAKILAISLFMAPKFLLKIISKSINI